MINDLAQRSSVAGAWMDEGMRKSVRLAVQGRFGVLSEDLRAAIQHAGEEALEAVLTHIATDTLEQLQARLSVNQG